MEHKIINTGDYLLIVDDSEIKENDWVADFRLDGRILVSKWNEADSDDGFFFDAKKIIAHLPLNNSPILEGVPLLPPLEDEVEKLFRDEHEQAVKRAGQEYAGGYYEGIHDGYNKAKEKYKYTEEDLRKAFRSGAYMGSYTGNNSGKHIEEAEEKFIKSLQQPKIPVGFKCEMEVLGRQIIETEKIIVEWQPIPEIDYMPKIKTTTNSQGLTQWVGEYIY